MTSRPSGCAHGPGPPTASHFENGPRRLSPDLKALNSLWETGQGRPALHSMVGVSLDHEPSQAPAGPGIDLLLTHNTDPATCPSQGT